VAVAVIHLITFRDDLRARLRRTRPTGVPLTEATAMLPAHLTAEGDLGRLTADADIDTLTPTSIGTGHLLFADRTNRPDAATIRKMVADVLAGVVTG
jgi:hypothetical protein